MFDDWRFVVAKRLFTSAGGNRLFSFVGLLAVAGLVIAVAVLVIVLSVMNGFERELRERVLGVIPHGYLRPRETATFSDWQAVREKALSRQGIVAAAPSVSGAALAVKAERLQGLTFNGVVPELERTLSILPDFVVEGSFESLEDDRFNALVGVELAAALGLGVGDTFNLVLPEVRYTLAGPALTTRKLTVSGIFRVGADVDRNYLLLSLGDAARLKRQRGVDRIAVRTADLFDAPTILLEAAAADGLFAESWMRRHGSLYDAIRTQKATMFLLLLILVAVAAFNVVSNLVMTVADNKAKIAVLRTLGASAADIRFTFFLHGIMVGVLGVLLGLVAGVLCTLALSPLFSFITGLSGLEMMTEYFIRYLPTDIHLADLLGISVVAFAICLLATLYPASRASKAQPARTLAYEG